MASVYLLWHWEAACFWWGWVGWGWAVWERPLEINQYAVLIQNFVRVFPKRSEWFWKKGSFPNHTSFLTWSCFQIMFNIHFQHKSWDRFKVGRGVQTCFFWQGGGGGLAITCCGSWLQKYWAWSTEKTEAMEPNLKFPQLPLQRRKRSRQGRLFVSLGLAIKPFQVAIGAQEKIETVTLSHWILWAKTGQ